MNSAWLDIAVRTLLSSTLVMAQAILVNWLRIPLAAIPLFAGIAAYGIIAGFTPTILLLSLVAIAFLVLVPYLPQDRYLLLSLAFLASARAVAGSLSRFGGELGMASTSSWIMVQRPTSALSFAVILFIVALTVLLLLKRTEFGLAVSVARTAGIDMYAGSMAPVGQLTALLLLVTIALAALTGAVQGAYTGWIDPDLFRIDHAIILLVATLVIGRMPVRGTLLAISFFLFPDLFSAIFGYDYTAAAHLREILWGGAIVILAGRTASPRLVEK